MICRADIFPITVHFNYHRGSGWVGGGVRKWATEESGEVWFGGGGQTGSALKTLKCRLFERGGGDFFTLKKQNSVSSQTEKWEREWKRARDRERASSSRSISTDSLASGLRLPSEANLTRQPAGRRKYTNKPLIAPDICETIHLPGSSSIQEQVD